MTQLRDGSIDSIYRDKVLTQPTRRYELRAPAKQLPVEVLHTLLGIELRIANRRLLCPDLATARYLAVFARVGCEAVAVPYDITRISRIADELEVSWHRSMLLADHLSSGRSERLRSAVRSRLRAEVGRRVRDLGAGARFPEFDQNTRRKR